MPGNLRCEYCNVNNPEDSVNCMACGAPLSRAKPVVPVQKPAAGAGVDTPALFRTGTTQEPAGQDLLDRLFGEGQGNQVVDKARQVLALLWRAAGEAIAIAISGFIIGVIGGGSGYWFLGVVGATVLGLVVGFTVKPLLFAALSAPIGTLLGLVIGFILRAFGVGSASLVLAASLLGIIAALVGGQIELLANRGCYTVARPFLGAAGGFLFGLLGVLLGGGIKALVSLFGG